MKINRLLFSKLVSLVRLKGDISNQTALLQTTNEGLLAATADKDASVLTHLLLKGKFESSTPFALRNLDHLVKTLEVHTGEEIDISLKENKMIVKDEEFKSSTVVSLPEYIKNSYDVSKFHAIRETFSPDYKLVLTALDVDKLIKSYDLNASKTREENCILFTVKNQELTVSFKSSSENELERKYKLGQECQDISIKLGTAFMETVKSIADGFEMTINENAVYIVKETDNFKLEYIVAGVV